MSDAFIRLSDSYHGNELGYWRQFGEQSASTSTTPSIRIIEASKSGASCNQKDRQEKKKAKYDTWSQPRIMSQPDAETSATSTKDDFESQLYLGEVFVFYV